MFQFSGVKIQTKKWDSWTCAWTDRARQT